MKTNLQDILENFEAINEKSIKYGVCEFCYVHKYGSNCINKYCYECEFRTSQAKNVLDYLNKERTPKIKLSPFEYDLLKSYPQKNLSFDSWVSLRNMQSEGYFKNIDPECAIEKILNHATVVVGVDIGGDKDAK